LVGSIDFSVSPGMRGRQMKPRNSHPAFSGKKAKEADGIVANVHVASSLLFYSQMNSLEDVGRFLPFCSLLERSGNPASGDPQGWRKAKKILKIL